MNVSEAVLTAMQKTNDLFSSQVVGKRVFNELDRVYTANARILPPGNAMIEGREQVKTFWRGAIEALGVKNAKLTTVDAEALEDRVFEVGRAELLTGSGDTLSVKYVVQWKQENGAWKWHVDIWNTNQ